ncbi:MAG: 50S ribosomal protein L3, partial [candidate division Zixibacteria bacterium]|nr:50S ribosomal protein L3 [candidate division Zixibacteria bacterium]
CPVVQIKTENENGYNAVQLGFEEIRETLVNMPMKGHYARSKTAPKRFLREVRVDDVEGIELGKEFRVDIFNVGDKVNISGVSKGLGFMGAVRRHGFAGGPKTHGQSDRWRAPGSIGQSSYPSRVFKGMRMSGRMGGDKVTVKNLTVVKVDADNNLICVRGAVPGKNRTFIKIRKNG